MAEANTQQESQTQQAQLNNHTVPTHKRNRWN